MSGTSSSAPSAPPTARVIRQRHQQLLTRNVAGDVSAEQRKTFVAEVCAAGAVTPPGRERDGLQTILYFWAGDQSSRGEREWSGVMPQLAAFDAGDASRSVDEAPPAVPPSTPAGLDAVLASSVAPVPITVAIKDLTRQIISGTAASSPAEKPAPKPDVDADADARARAILQIAAVARRWRASGFAKGYLLSGAALDEAARYAAEDPEIQALVEASRIEDAVGARERKLRRWIVALSLLATLTSVIAFYRTWHESEALIAANSELLAARKAQAEERDEVRQRARGAIGALSQGSVGPLRAFLQRYGEGDPAELERLELRAAPSTTATVEAAPATPSRSAQPHSFSAADDSCKGFLWFGSRDDSRLADRRDPATLRSGETVRMDDRNDIRLRQQLPSADYVMGRQTGLVPAGASVRLNGDPVSFVRRSASQYWAQVEVPRAYCTSVFLQYVGPMDRRNAAIGLLQGLDVQTPPAQQIATAKGLAEIRYYYPEDAAMADEVAQALAPLNQGRPLRVVPLLNYPSKPPVPGTIEAWLDLGS